MSRLIYGFIIIIVNFGWLYCIIKFLLMKEYVSKIKNPIVEKATKFVVILGMTYYMTSVLGSALIDGMLLPINGEPIFYCGDVSESVLMHEQKVNRKIYNITLIMEGEEVLFEDIRVGNREADKIAKGDTIEICYNPGMEGVVSKVNGEETPVYKYHYKKQGYPTVLDTIIVGIVFLINQIIHLVIYKKEYRKDISNKWEKTFQKMWKYGGIIFSLLLFLTLCNVINYYSIRIFMKITYYVFVTGEFFSLLAASEFKWVTLQEERCSSDLNELKK